MKLTPLALVLPLLLPMVAKAGTLQYPVVKVAKPGLSGERDEQGRPYRNDVQFLGVVEDDGSRVKVLGVNFLFLMHVKADGTPGFTKAPSSMADSYLRQRFPISRSNPRHAASCERAAPDVPCDYLSLSAPEIDWVQNGLTNKAIILRAEKRNGKLDVGTYIEKDGKAVRINAVVILSGDNPSIGSLSADFVVKSVVVSTSAGNFNWPCVNLCHKHEGIMGSTASNY